MSKERRVDAQHVVVNAIFLLALREIDKKKKKRKNKKGWFYIRTVFRYCCNRILKTAVNDEKEKKKKKKRERERDIAASRLARLIKLSLYLNCLSFTRCIKLRRSSASFTSQRKYGALARVEV